VAMGATQWWVDLNNTQNFAEFFDTGLVQIV
jgi:hypothetical protein